LQQRLEIFLEVLSNSRPAVRLYSEGRATSLAEDHFRRTQGRNLDAGYLPDDCDPSQADEATGCEIHALNKEMIAAATNP